jgi:hypothetical protein
MSNEGAKGKQHHFLKERRLVSAVYLIRRLQTAAPWLGGRGGIRTHGGFNPTLDFESSALNRTQPPFPFCKIDNHSGERWLV